MTCVVPLQLDPNNNFTYEVVESVWGEAAKLFVDECVICQHPNMGEADRWLSFRFPSLPFPSLPFPSPDSSTWGATKSMLRAGV